MGKLENKSAVITGAGSGLGRATALLFAKEGAKLVLTDVSEPRLNETMEIFKANGFEAATTLGDICKKETAVATIGKAVELYGKLDILVNSAGLGDGFSPCGDMTDEEWDLIMGVDLNGTFYHCREALKVMVEQKSGVIVNFSSACGITGGRQGAAYVTAKWAVRGLTKNIASMYADMGIRCNAILPGGIPTNFLKLPDGSKVVKNKPFMMKALSGGETNPLVPGKLGLATPENIADIVLFMSCDDSKIINGTDFVADGGWTAY